MGTLRDDDLEVCVEGSKRTFIISKNSHPKTKYIIDDIAKRICLPYAWTVQNHTVFVSLKFSEIEAKGGTYELPRL